MILGEIFHIIHNVVLTAVYLLIGTVYLPGFIQRLDIPYKMREWFTLFSLAFFVLCALTHIEMLVHMSELPEDYYAFYHNFFGMLQSVGAVGFLVMLHMLIYPSKSKSNY